jgi:hypothetical protein
MGRAGFGLCCSRRARIRCMNGLPMSRFGRPERDLLGCLTPSLMRSRGVGLLTLTIFRHLPGWIGFGAVTGDSPQRPGQRPVFRRQRLPASFLDAFANRRGSCRYQDRREDECCRLPRAICASVVGVAAGELDDQDGGAPDREDGAEDGVPHTGRIGLRRWGLEGNGRLSHRDTAMIANLRPACASRLYCRGRGDVSLSNGEV